MKLPDAIVIATAGTSGADQLITTDQKRLAARATELTVAVERS